MIHLLQQVFNRKEGMSVKGSIKLDRAIVLYDLNKLEVLDLNRKDAEDKGFYYNSVSKEFTPLNIEDDVIELSPKEFKERIKKLEILIKKENENNIN